MYLIIFFLFFFFSNSPIANYSIIPLPKEIIEIEGSPFLLSNLTQITYSPSSSLQKNNSEYLSNCIFEKTKIKVKINPNLSLDIPNIIYLQINETINMSEQYIIIINQNNITIQSKTSNGIFYGIQTIFKSLPITIKNPEIKEISFPQIYINDYPLFSYRGMMLDSSRHYYSIDFIKKFLNLLSLHNMNKFHWHLSDDQGWRIEIKKYPLLTKKSSFRSKTVINKNSGYYDDIPYGGFYTQDEAREVVEYARMLYIDVIRNALPLKAVHERIHARLDDLVEAALHCAEPRLGQGGAEDVVKSRDEDVFGNPYSRVGEGRDGSEGHFVICRDDGVWELFAAAKEGPHCLGAPLALPYAVKVSDAVLRNPVFRAGVFKCFPALVSFAVLPALSAFEIEKRLCPVGADEVLGNTPGGGIVVGADADAALHFRSDGNSGNPCLNDTVLQVF